MQILSIQVQDSYIQNFMNYINQHNTDISVIKDKNLELDPYFYERKKKLHQIRDDVHNGKIKLLTQEESDNEIEQFFIELESN